jgi:hypothetical protein
MSRRECESLKHFRINMAEIILAKNGAVLQRIPLTKERTTIGRRTYNDIVIDEPGVSAEHAVLVFALGGLYFQDMGSTNGSRINGQPVEKHFLNDGDVIELGQHTMRYHASAEPLALQRDAMPGGSAPGELASSTRPFPADAQNGCAEPALIEILSGPYSGRKVPLTQPLTTIGSPGVQIAVLARGRYGYSLTHVEGKTHPMVNGKSSGTATLALSNGDLLDLAGTKIRFSLASTGLSK